MSSEVEEVEYPYVERNVDPTKLVLGENMRKVGDVRTTFSQLVGQIIARGMDPRAGIVSVMPNEDGEFVVLTGFHRVAAARTVKEVERPDLVMNVLVHAPGASRRDILLAQGAENEIKKAVTDAERVSYIEQLELEGVSEEEMEASLSYKREEVRAARRIAASPRTKAATERLDGASLFDMDDLCEFENEPEIHADLAALLETDREEFDAVLEARRGDRRCAALQLEREEELRQEGYTVIDSDDEEEDEDDEVEEGAAPKPEPIEGLCSAEGAEALTAEAHADCPGRAAKVSVNPHTEVVRVEELCADYAAHGHRLLGPVKADAERARLAEKGVRLVGEDALQQDGAAKLWSLYPEASSSRWYSAETHASCPGHAAIVTPGRYGQRLPDVTYLCDDYVGQGHFRTGGVSHSDPGPSAAYVAAEKKRTRVNNPKWLEGTKVRRPKLAKWFKGWRSRKAADLPSDVQVWLARAAIELATYVREAEPNFEYAVKLLGLRPRKGQSNENLILAQLEMKSTTETQATLIRLAMYVGAAEAHWDRGYAKTAAGSWRSPTSAARFYFQMLKKLLGITLSFIEELVIDPKLDKANWPHLRGKDEAEEIDGESVDGEEDEAEEDDSGEVAEAEEEEDETS